MPIILNMSKEEFEKMRTDVANAESLEERLGFLEPMQKYDFRDEMPDETAWNDKYNKLQGDYRDLQQKYIDRFFSGTMEIPPKEEPPKTEPMKYEDLYE